MQAFEIAMDDLVMVLRQQWSRVSNTGGDSFKTMAARLFYDLDTGRIEEAALNAGTDLNEQLKGAYDAIAEQLVEMGVLEPMRQAPVSALGTAFDSAFASIFGSSTNH